jgi:hypothetical protein
MFRPRALAVYALSAAMAAPAFATTVALTADGQWHPFAVDALLAPAATPLVWIDDSGEPLNFSFVVGAGFVGQLTVVDGVFAGDTFALTNFGALLGSTSAVPAGTYEASPNLGYDFDAALADPANFSHGQFAAAAGAYSIGGWLAQSVTLDGDPLNATVGAVRLTIAAVPEPSTYTLLLAGLGVCFVLAHRLRR